MFFNVYNIRFKYILRIKDKDGNIYDKSTWAGIPRNSLNIDQARELSLNKYNKDFNFKVTHKNVFLHNNKNLTIAVEDIDRRIQFNSDKPLVGNEFLEICI